MTKKVLRKYAELVARVGANVQKNQEVIINANVDQVEFVSLVVEECYKCGAKMDKIEAPVQKTETKDKKEKKSKKPLIIGIISILFSKNFITRGNHKIILILIRKITY